MTTWPGHARSSRELVTFLPQAGPVPSRIPSRAGTLALTFWVSSKGQNQVQPGAWSRSPPTGLWSALARGLYRGQQRPGRGANDSYHSHGSGKAHLAPARRLPADSEGSLYENRSTHGSSRRSERSDCRLLGNKCVLSRGGCHCPSFKDHTGHKFSSCGSFRYSELSHLWSRERGRELRSQGHPKRGLD